MSDTASLIAPETDAYKPCDGYSQFCSALGERLEDGHKKGINSMAVMNLMTGDECPSLIVYKTSSHDRGLVLNFCPWCGKKLNRRVLSGKVTVSAGAEVVNV